jgi:hypothetical protein
VHIAGNLIIEGVLDSQKVTETILQVEDKEIVLASSSNGQAQIYDGTANTGAGIVINGIPQLHVTADKSGLVEKSIRWHQNQDGVLGLGAFDMDKESYWEVMGGSLRITNQKLTYDGSGDVTGSYGYTTFGFRINSHDELELVKITSSNNNVSTKRIAKFGRTLV